MYFATASVHPTGPVHAFEGVWKCGEDVKACHWTKASHLSHRAYYWPTCRRQDSAQAIGGVEL